MPAHLALWVVTSETIPISYADWQGKDSFVGTAVAFCSTASRSLARPRAKLLLSGGSGNDRPQAGPALNQEKE